MQMGYCFHIMTGATQFHFPSVESEIFYAVLWRNIYFFILQSLSQGCKHIASLLLFLWKIFRYAPLFGSTIPIIYYLFQDSTQKPFPKNYHIREETPDSVNTAILTSLNQGSTFIYTPYPHSLHFLPHLSFV